MNDEFYIEECFKLALKAQGETSPNPLVGCVIVKDDHILASGYHKTAGLDHAEADALKHLNGSAKGATLYCNLEPCCHTNKRTPPCTEAIIKSGVTRVVISNLDPNPEVSGSGIRRLKEAGIEVTTHVLENKGEEINEVFFTNMRFQRAFIHIKMASSLDGNIAMNNGDSKWITSQEMRTYTHTERYRYDAIAVGRATYEIDHPSLTIRHPELKEKNLKKIILTQTDFKTDRDDVTIINTKEIESLSHYLYQEMGIHSLYIEAGTRLMSALINQKQVDRVTLCFAPKLLGAQMRSAGELSGVNLQNPITFKNIKWLQFGLDMAFTGTL